MKGLSWTVIPYCNYPKQWSGCNDGDKLILRYYSLSCHGSQAALSLNLINSIFHRISTRVLLFFSCSSYGTSSPWIAVIYCGNITVMSKWVRWRLKSPASWLFIRPFVKAQIKKISELHVIGLCVTLGFPAQRASNVENVSICWRHHESYDWPITLANSRSQCVSFVNILLLSLIYYPLLPLKDLTMMWQCDNPSKHTYFNDQLLIR